MGSMHAVIVGGSRGRTDLDRARNERLASRAALREAHARVAPGAGAPRLRHRATGAPFLAGGRRLYCSLSYAGGFGAGAVGTVPLGVDLEPVGRWDRRTLAYVAAREEVGRVSPLATDGSELLTIIWTAKEAVLKALGCGLAIAPRQLWITGRRADTLQIAAPDGSGWAVGIERRADIVFAIAVPEWCDERPAKSWHQRPRV